MKIFPTLFCFLLGLAAQGQMQIADVDATKLGYKKVAKYMKNGELKQLRFFSDIQPSVGDSCDLSRLYFHHGTYTVGASVQQTWSTCVNTSPAALWKGKMLGLSCVYSPCADSLLYACDGLYSQLELNQIYFINLRIMRLFNVAAALMTTRMDSNERLIEFTYIKGNKSIGRQTIRLLEVGDGETMIVHDTFYKSGSRFRDKRLYPRFHQVSITDLHRNIEAYSVVKIIEDYKGL
jgi:hypothetical protein